LTPKNCKLTHLTYKLLPPYFAKCKSCFLKQYSTVISIERSTFQKVSKHVYNIHRPVKTVKTSLTTLHYSQCSKCTDKTMESVYSTTRSADPQCAAGMQSISETDTATTLAQ